MNYVLQTLIPVLEAEITSVTLNGTSGRQDGFDYTLSGISCHAFTIGSSAITTGPTTGITLSLNNLNLACSASWSFRLHVSGDAFSCIVSRMPNAALCCCLSVRSLTTNTHPRT